MINKFVLRPVIALMLFVAGLATVSGQSNFSATVDANALLQISQLLPEKSSYQFDLSHLPAINSDLQARAFFRKYFNAKFIDFQFDFPQKRGSMVIKCSMIMDSQPTKESINYNLKMVQRYGN